MDHTGERHTRAKKATRQYGRSGKCRSHTLHGVLTDRVVVVSVARIRRTRRRTRWGIVYRRTPRRRVRIQRRLVLLGRSIVLGSRLRVRRIVDAGDCSAGVVYYTGDCTGVYSCAVAEDSHKRRRPRTPSFIMVEEEGKGISTPFHGSGGLSKRL
jgi:hypothetical protein